jgi:putative heme-binding domain-containing protein
MSRAGLGALVLCACLATGHLTLAQGRGRGGAAAGPAPAANNPNNPVEGNADAILSGKGHYGARCAACHGNDARGVTGPDLTELWASASVSDDGGLFRIVQRGVPGTEMPGFAAAGGGLSEREIWETLAYVRSLATVSPTANPSGDAVHGDALFRTRCASCHVVNGLGGELGPDLSRIGAARSRAALATKIRGTSTSIRAGYEPVTLVTRDGRRIRGARKNEDSFSIQIMDTGERIQGYLKSDLSSIVRESQSLMPAFGPDRLADRDLDDVLRYLGTLRGVRGTSAAGAPAEEPR